MYGKGTRSNADDGRRLFRELTTEVEVALLFYLHCMAVILLCLAKGLGRISRINSRVERALHGILEFQN